VVGTYTVKPCQLELTGTVDVSTLALGCSSGTTLSGSLTVSGTWQADALGNVWDNTITEGVHEFRLPAACLEVPIVGSCGAIGTPLRHALGYTTAECVDNPERGGCTCTATFSQQGGMAEVSITPLGTGTYTTQGTTLTTSDRGLLRTYDHCVVDDGVVLSIPTPGKIGQVVGSIVLQKD
jgi:hypothetical protein